MRVVVTGGAGFIGSHMADGLLAAGHDVLALDNFATGLEQNLADASTNAAFRQARCDLYLEPERLAALFEGHDAIVHLAANADVRFGWEAPSRDLEQNVIVTHNVLEAMRTAGLNRLLFSSTGSVYGETEVVPTPEDAPFPLQTSLYGASKAAAEAYIQAYARGSGISATIFRFVSVLGRRYSHGHVIDFVRQLIADPSHLTILGDGNQRKSYLEVTDCVAAMLNRLEDRPQLEILNLGVDSYCTVRESASWICERMSVSPSFEFTGGNRGWVGDNPFIFLETARMRSLGWEPRYTIREAVEATVDDLLERSDELAGTSAPRRRDPSAPRIA